MNMIELLMAALLMHDIKKRTSIIANEYDRVITGHVINTQYKKTYKNNR